MAWLGKSVPRAALASSLVLLLLVAAPPTMAHGQGQGFGHLNVDVRELGPGENRTLHLEPSMESGPLQADWVFITYALVEGPAPVMATLTYEGVPTSRFLWVTGANSNSTRLQFSGEHDLTLNNPSRNESTKYAFYFDQSCNCAGKLIPLPGGFVLFNYDLPAGRDVFIGFPLISGWHIRGAVATLPGEDARWPSDFSNVTSGEARGPGWLNLTFRTSEAERYYVFVEALDGASLEDPLDLTPLVEVEGGSTPVGPGLVWVGTLAALVGARAQRTRRP